MKLPGGGTWPAFWLLPTNSPYGGWPNGGEIDIMEHYGCESMNVETLLLQFIALCTTGMVEFTTILLFKPGN